MRPGPRNLISDVAGLRVGNEVAILDQRREGRTGDALPQRLADPLTDRVVVVAERLAVLPSSVVYRQVMRSWNCGCGKTTRGPA